VPLSRKVFELAKKTPDELAGIGYTEGPGLAGALLVGAAFARGLAATLGIPALGIHHLEGHLLSPLLSARAPRFPFVALLVSGGHTQLMRVEGVGRYAMLGETQDDAAGEAFDKTAKLMDLGYPGGPALAKLAESGTPGRFKFSRPMTDRPGLDFSFSGLKTQVLLAYKAHAADPAAKADIARGFEDAIVDTLAIKCRRALAATGSKRLVIAGGVGANRTLRARLAEAAGREGFRVYFPRLEFCTDNGAMIALAGALRLRAGLHEDASIRVQPRWDLESLPAVGGLRAES
jgi:N6-L-threonylcarbamoyladenine synthase